MRFWQKFTRIFEKKLLAALAGFFFFPNFFQERRRCSAIHLSAKENNFGNERDDFLTIFIDQNFLAPADLSRRRRTNFAPQPPPADFLSAPDSTVKHEDWRRKLKILIP